MHRDLLRSLHAATAAKDAAQLEAALEAAAAEDRVQQQWQVVRLARTVRGSAYARRLLAEVVADPADPELAEAAAELARR